MTRFQQGTTGGALLLVVPVRLSRRKAQSVANRRRRLQAQDNFYHVDAAACARASRPDARTNSLDSRQSIRFQFSPPGSVMFALAIAVVVAAILGTIAASSRTFSEGGGLILLFIGVIAVVVAGVCGVLIPLLSAEVGLWVSRIVIVMLVFVVCTMFAR